MFSGFHQSEFYIIPAFRYARTDSSLPHRRLSLLAHNPTIKTNPSQHQPGESGYNVETKRIPEPDSHLRDTAFGEFGISLAECDCV